MEKWKNGKYKDTCNMRAHARAPVHVYKCDGSFAGQVVPKDQREKPLLSSSGNQREKKQDQKEPGSSFPFSLSLSCSFSSISRVFLLVYGEERLSSLSGRRSIKIYSRAVKSSADFRLALPAKAAIFLCALSLSTFSPPSSEIYFLILACHG